MSEGLREQLQAGIDLFNRRRYYECHDTIEAVWLQESSDRHGFLQGLIQAAVAFFHYQEGRLGASRKMLAMSLEKLEPYAADYDGLDLERLRQDLSRWKRALDRAITEKQTQVPQTLPTIERLPTG